MRRPITAPTADHRRRGRVLTGIAGAVLAAALGITGALGVGSLSGPVGYGRTVGHGHGVHTDVQSWS